MRAHGWLAARKLADRRVARIVALKKELDVQGSRSTERTRTIETKAAFTATVAAVVIAASISMLTSTPAGAFATLPLTLAITTVVISTRAIRPLSLEVVSARKLLTKYVDNEMSPEELDDHLLEIRVREIEQRDLLNVKRAWVMVWGFRLLAASVVTLLVVSITGSIFSIEMNPDDESRTPRPSETVRSP